MSLPRSLTDKERHLVRWMIEHQVAEPGKYLRELGHAVVASECPCGCASIDFQIEGQTPNCTAGIQIIADYEYGPESLPFGAFVFTCNDMLAGLEVYSSTDTPARYRRRRNCGRRPM